jgi:hypothetical protein
MALPTGGAAGGVLLYRHDLRRLGNRALVDSSALVGAGDIAPLGHAGALCYDGMPIEVGTTCVAKKLKRPIFPSVMGEC